MKWIRQWMILYAVLLHWVWGATLLSSSTPLGVTAISAILTLGIVSGTTVGLFYLLIAFLALIGIFAPRPVNTIFLLPQTIVLWIGAYGASQAMWLGVFADGVIRPRSFLIADQAPAIIAAICHTGAVVFNFFESRSNPYDRPY